MLTKDGFLAKLRERIGGNQTRYGEKVGVTQAYVSKVVLGKRSPSAKILEDMGYKRVEMYMPVE